MRSWSGEGCLDGAEVLTSVKRAVHQALSPSLHNLRNDIGFERPYKAIDLCSRCQAILDGGSRRDDGPLLQGRVIDQFQKSVVERKRCTTPRGGGEHPPGANESIPKRHMGKERR